MTEGFPVLLGLGTLAMMLLGCRNDIITTGITTTAVMVVAVMSPQNAWQKPLPRLVDTVVGVAAGVSCKWIASLLFSTLIGSRPSDVRHRQYADSSSRRE